MRMWSPFRLHDVAVAVHGARDRLLAHVGAQLEPAGDQDRRVVDHHPRRVGRRPRLARERHQRAQTLDVARPEPRGQRGLGLDRHLDVRRVGQPGAGHALGQADLDRRPRTRARRAAPGRAPAGRRAWPPPRARAYAGTGGSGRRCARPGDGPARARGRSAPARRARSRPRWPAAPRPALRAAPPRSSAPAARPSRAAAARRRSAARPGARGRAGPRSSARRPWPPAPPTRPSSRRTDCRATMAPVMWRLT